MIIRSSYRLECESNKQLTLNLLFVGRTRRMTQYAASGGMHWDPIVFSYPEVHQKILRFFILFLARTDDTGLTAIAPSQTDCERATARRVCVVRCALLPSLAYSRGLTPNAAYGGMHDVTGSSPVRGARKNTCFCKCFFQRCVPQAERDVSFGSDVRFAREVCLWHVKRNTSHHCDRRAQHHYVKHNITLA